MRPPRPRNTKHPRANWHGSKASPAAIWLDRVSSISAKNATGETQNKNDNEASGHTANTRKECDWNQESLESQSVALASQPERARASACGHNRTKGQNYEKGIAEGEECKRRNRVCDPKALHDPKWSNEKAQVRPRRLRETKRSQANWHGSKASPAAIWFDIVFITQNSRLHYEEPQTRQPSGLGRKSHRRKRRQRRTAGPSFPSWPSVGMCSKLGRPRSGRTKKLRCALPSSGKPSPHGQTGMAQRRHLQRSG